LTEKLKKEKHQKYLASMETLKTLKTLVMRDRQNTNNCCECCETMALGLVFSRSHWDHRSHLCYSAVRLSSVCRLYTECIVAKRCVL